jgi:CDP-diacylglycerol--serine O-phosphatidyltransferase
MPAAVGWWRYAVPNGFTALSIVFGVLAVQQASAGHILAAAWWGLYGTLTDRLDGAAAKWLGAQSEFGVQFDSLADLCIFGVAPPAVLYAFFSRHPELGWSTTATRAALVALCVAFTLATAVRLARFNVAATQGPVEHYTGTPSTMTAGLLLITFVTVLKYSSPAWVAPETNDPWRLLGGLDLEPLLAWTPLLLGLGAAGMLSSLRVPRLGRTRHRATTILLIVLVAAGYGAGLFHRLPEYLLAGGLYYLGVCIAYHLRTR